MPTQNRKHDKLIDRFELRDLGIPWGNVTLLRKEREGIFPRRVRLSSHCVRWRLSEVTEFLRRLNEERAL